MSNTYQSTENLVDRVNRYIAENKKSITDVAGEIDYARSTLSQYLSGKYKSDSTEIEEKLIEFLEKVESDNSSVKINREFFISEDTGNIMAICKACQEEGELGMIVGRSGFGKTKTLKKYATLDRVVYIECDVSMACRDLIEAIEEGIGLPEGRGSIWKRVNTIKQFFEINKGYLLIVDEADKLISKDTITKLEILRTIFDHVKTKREEESSNMYSFGLVVAGEPNLESLIRTLDVRFANRICFYYSLKGLSREEVTEYLQGFDITNQALEELISRATNHQTGCFRLLDRTLKNVLRLDYNDKKITLQLINQASSMMML